ncbi:MAG: hypothetical protein V1872_12005 [bacterium]
MSDSKIINIIKLKDVLFKHYSSDILQSLYDSYLNRFVQENSKELKESGYKYLSSFFEKRKIKIGELVDLLVIIYSKQNLIKKLLSILPPTTARIFDTLVWNGARKVTELEKELKIKLLEEPQGKFFYYSTLKYTEKSYYFFCLSNDHGHYYSSDGYTIFLPDKIRDALKSHLTPPEDYNLHPLSQIGKTDFLYENNDEILRELPIHYEYIRQGQMKYSKNGKPLKTSLQMLRQYVTTREFYEVKGRKDLELLKTNLMIALVKSTKNDVPGSKDTIVLLRQVIGSYTKGDKYRWNLDNILFHLKGRSQMDMDYCFTNKDINSTLLLLLKNLPLGSWISIDNLLKFIIYRDIDLMFIKRERVADYLYFTAKFKSDGFDRRVSIAGEYFNKGLIFPLVKGNMFLFASLGLIDIAYNLPSNDLDVQTIDKEYLSVFDGVKYIRLTNLGAYVIGKIQSYTPAIQTESAKGEIILDHNRLILTLNGEDKIKRMTLERLSERIGENRYKLDYTSFLQGCGKKKDVEQKINLFKRAVSSNLPTIWVDFFEDVLARIHPLTRQETFLTYKISMDKNLIHLIATDSILKKYILKAENYYILIEQENFNKVKNRLESLGYLV